MSDRSAMRRGWVQHLAPFAIAAAVGGALGAVLCVVALARGLDPYVDGFPALVRIAGWASTGAISSLPAGLAILAVERLAGMRLGSWSALGVVAVTGVVVAATGWRDASLPTPAPDAVAPPPLATAQRPIPHNVVLLTIDTLRRDHLGVYGHARPTSPHLDAFAVGGAVFETAIAQASATLRSTASIVTGLYPHVLDADLARRDGRGPFVPPGIPTLASHLAAAGYATGGFVSNPYLVREAGFAQGFDHFDETSGMFGDGPEGRRADAFDVVEPALAWIAGAGRPFFLWIHVMDPHHPYEPASDAPWERPDDVAARVLRDAYARRSIAETTAHLNALARGATAFAPGELDFLIDRYDAEILQTDRAFARLREGLAALGIGDHDTVTAVTADHGEEFLEHGLLLHSYTLFDEVIRVPLLLAGPGVPPGLRVQAQTPLVDLAPTVLALVGLRARGLDGDSLVPWLEGARPDARAALSQRDTKYTALRTQTSKLIAPFDAPAHAWPPPRSLAAMVQQLVSAGRRPKVGLYRLDVDPAEQDDRIHVDRPTLDALRAALETMRAGAPPRRLDDPAPPEATPGLRESLRALGYVE